MDDLLRIDESCTEEDCECCALWRAHNGMMRAEVERLRRWKTEAALVLDAWNKVYQALGQPGALGESLAAASLAKVKQMQSTERRVRALHQSAEGSLGMGSPYRYCAVEGMSAPWPCLTIAALDGEEK